jgi:hypothetical protein
MRPHADPNRIGHRPQNASGIRLRLLHESVCSNFGVGAPDQPAELPKQASNAYEKSGKFAWHMPCKLPFDDRLVICEALMARDVAQRRAVYGSG